MADDDGFIGLPPGITDSGTFKSPPRVERPRTERPEVVFVPTAPGAPVPAAPASDPATVETPAAGVPIVPSPAPPAAPAASATWTLSRPDGATTTVAAALLLGRNPARVPGWEGADLLAIDDPAHSVSKTHAAFQVDGEGLWVHDLDSTNGVWVVVGDDATEVIPGQRVAVPPGAVVELGEFALRVARG